MKRLFFLNVLITFSYVFTSNHHLEVSQYIDGAIEKGSDVSTAASILYFGKSSILSFTENGFKNTICVYC